MRIKFETDNGISRTECPHQMINTVTLTPTIVASWLCQKCPHYRGTEGNEVICGREEE